MDTNSIHAKQKAMSLDSAKIRDYILRKTGDEEQLFDHEINVLLTLSKNKSDSSYHREKSSTCPNNLVFVKKTTNELIFPSVVADNIKDEIGIGRVKFFTKQGFPNLVKAINMLEVIYKDDNGKYIIKGSKLNRTVLRVGLTEKLELDKELSSCIRTMLGLANFELDRRLHTFHICHRSTKQYTMTTNIEMSFSGQERTLEQNPDLTAVLRKVWQISRGKSKTPSAAETILKSSTLFWDIKISFSNPSAKTKSPTFRPLQKFLPGSFYSVKDGKFGETWYTMDDDYLIEIHIQFQKILQDHLVSSSKHICPLPLP
jgi:hypothetical protein